MKRSGFKPKIAVPARQDRSTEFQSYVPRPRPTAPSVALLECPSPAAAPRVVDLQKIPQRVHQAIRDSARGEECQVRIVGACSFDPEKTIWSHAPLQAAGKGRGIKAIDVAGAYCCTACDAVIDGQAPLPPGATRDSVMVDWLHGHLRSLVLLQKKGLIR